MATASQDRYVRVWSFEDLHVDLSRLDVYAPKPQLRLGGRGAGRQKTVAVVCEALLAGHEDWVHGVRWMVAGDGDQQLTLLSSSMDRTMILWQQVSDDGGSVGTYLGVCMYGVEEGLIPGARYGGNEYIDDQCEQGAAGGPPPSCGVRVQFTKHRSKHPVVRQYHGVSKAMRQQRTSDPRVSANLVVRQLLARNLTSTSHNSFTAYYYFTDALFEDGAALWQSVSVVGDAGVNHLGYYTCAWRPGGRSIATHGMSWCGWVDGWGGRLGWTGSAATRSLHWNTRSLLRAGVFVRGGRGAKRPELRNVELVG